MLYGTGRLSSFAIGSANSKFGSKATVCVGLTLRVAGISIFAFDSTLVPYLIFSGLASIGSSASALGIKTELLRFSASRKLITMRSMAINSGAIIGPALGAALYHYLSFHVILYVSIGVYLVLAAIMCFVNFSPPEASQEPAGKNAGRVNSYTGYFFITLLAALYWAIYSQWSIVVPLLSEQAIGYKEASSVVYMANALIVLCLQYPLLVVLLKSVRDTSILLLGFFLFFTTFWIVIPAPSVVTVACFCCGFSVAELLVSPTLDSQTAKLAPANLGLTRAYGFQDTLTGIFAICGSALGGYLIELANGLSGSTLLGVPVAACAMIVVQIMRNNRKDSTK